MKYLILILFLSSCTKVSRQSILPEAIEEMAISTLEEDFSNYSETIDVMVAFLWPAVVETESQRQAIRAVIRNSRELKVLQESYLTKKLELSTLYQQERCECALNGLCEEEEIPNNPEKCESIESQIFENERNLPEIFSVVEKIEKNVVTSGGEWIATHNDFTDGPAGNLSFENLKLDLPAFGSFIEADEFRPVAYENLPVKVLKEKTYLRVLVEFERLRLPGMWKFDMGIKRSHHSISVQGELFFNYLGVKREGVIYWVNPRKI